MCLSSIVSWKDSNASVDFGWFVFRHIIESIQFLSVLMVLSFPWPDAIVTAFDWMGYLRIDATGVVFLIFFVLIFVCFGCYILITIILIFPCGGELFESCSDNMWELAWYFIGDTILFGILFIPCTSISLEMFHCESGYVANYNSMKCWTSGHIILCIMSLLILIFLIFGVRAKAKAVDLSNHNSKSKQRLRADVHHIKARFFVIRFMGLILTINIASISNIAASMLLFLLFLYPACYVTYYIPYINMKYNYIRVSMHSFNLWSSLAVIITVLTPHQYIGFIIWCAFPLFILIIIFLCKKRLLTRPLTADDLQKAMDDIGDNTRINQKIKTKNPYLDANQYETVSNLLINKQDLCISLKPISMKTFLYELQTNKSKLKQLKQFKKEKKEKKEKKASGKTKTVDNEIEIIMPDAKEWRSDFLCIYSQNQTELSQRQDLNDNELKELSKCIAQCNDLIVLSLKGWNLKGESIQKFIDVALCDSMNGDCHHNNLRIIDFGDNQMNFNDAKYILDEIYSIQENCDDMKLLKEICLANNYIGDSKGSELQREHPLGSILIV